MPTFLQDRLQRTWALVAMLVALVSMASSLAWGESFEDWLRHLASSEDVERRILARVEAAGGTPLRSGDELLYLARSRQGKVPSIVGDFNDGGYAKSAALESGPMHRIGESDWYELRASSAEDARFEYQIRWGQATEPDPLNGNRSRTFGADRSVVQSSEFRRPPSPTKSDRGTVQRFTLTSQARNNERSVAVYLPSGYDPRGPRLPTLYVKDGTRFTEDVELPTILDALIEQNQMPRVVVVFIDPVDRALEYGTSGKYRDLVVSELVPEVERRFAAGGHPQLRGLFGTSRGGLAAVDLAVQHPGVFGFCAVMSAALSPLPIVDEIAAAERVKGSFLVLISRYDSPGLLRDGRALAAALEGRADEMVSREIPIDHSPLGWKAWSDFVLLQWREQMRLGLNASRQ